MSKMRKPEMSVVRFSEDDIIVASTGLRLNKYGDGTPHNAYITFNGQNYGNSVYGYDYDRLYRDYNAENPGVGLSENTNFGWDGSGSGENTLSAILQKDNTTDHSSCDGYYIWTGEGFSWSHQ